MRPLQHVETAHLYLPLHEQLMGLLAGLPASAWTMPTVCPGWAVRDIAAHLLDVDLRRLSFSRDGFDPPPPESPISGYRELVAFLNRLNDDWVRAARRFSPRVLTELLALSGPAVAAHVISMDMDGPARFPVAWAGETVSLNWLDVARDYTERWHHQQQIRDATGAPGLTTRQWLFPVLDTFIRALPHTYRGCEAPSGAVVEIEIEGEAGGTWSLERGSGQWTLFAGAAPARDCKIALSQDTAWRLFTHGLSPGDAAPRVRMEGDSRLGAPFLGTLAVMA